MKQMIRMGLCWTALVLITVAHSGGLDSEGGHTNRKTGEYHFHHKSEKQAPKPVAGIPSTVSSSVKSKRIGDYFKAFNLGVINYKGGTSERHVPQRLKQSVRARDGHQCIICGSTQQLEVDHARALMNGGSNSIDNLKTLCDSCHLEKTRMDNALRRKRLKS